MGKATRLVRSRTVTGDGEGLVSHAGLVWLGEVAERSGLAGGLSEVLAEAPRRRRDPGVGLAQLTLALADGAECLSDLTWMLSGVNLTCSGRCHPARTCSGPSTRWDQPSFAVSLVPEPRPGPPRGRPAPGPTVTRRSSIWTPLVRWPLGSRAGSQCRSSRPSTPDSEPATGNPG
jgi:hypothetical protein